MAAPTSQSATDRTERDYRRCLIKPMSEDDDGDGLFRVVHILDATIVGAIVFFAILLSETVPQLLAGQGAYVTPEEVVARLTTAFIAFALTFVAQWARFRGIKMVPWAPTPPTTRSDNDQEGDD